MVGWWLVRGLYQPNQPIYHHPWMGNPICNQPVGRDDTGFWARLKWRAFPNIGSWPTRTRGSLRPKKWVKDGKNSNIYTNQRSKDRDTTDVQRTGQLLRMICTWRPAANQEMDDEDPSKPGTAKEVRDVPLCQVGFGCGRYWPLIAVWVCFKIFDNWPPFGVGFFGGFLNWWYPKPFNTKIV